MLIDNTRKYLCRVKGLYDQKQYMIPENIYGRLQKITGNGLAAGCQLFYRKIYGYFLQCRGHRNYFRKFWHRNGLYSRTSVARTPLEL